LRLEKQKLVTDLEAYGPGGKKQIEERKVRVCISVKKLQYVSVKRKSGSVSLPITKEEHKSRYKQCKFLFYYSSVEVCLALRFHTDL
jgi:hypothetical protein